MTLLRKHPKPTKEGPPDNVEGKKKKRRALVDFFRSRRRKTQENETDQQPAKPIEHKTLRDSKVSIPEPHEKLRSVDEKTPSEAAEPQDPHQLPTPPPEPTGLKPQILREEDIRRLFSGAPQFRVTQQQDRYEPTASYPWNNNLSVQDVTDSAALGHSAFSAATLRRHVPTSQHRLQESSKTGAAYDVGIAEVPNMLSAHGLEPGTVGFDHFMELPISDILVTDVEESQLNNGLPEATRNKELLHNSPERLGMKPMDLAMINERLVDLGDLWDAIRDAPGKTTILNNQSSGELYANLFGKFLTPPRFDPDTDDPTGLKVQIETLLKILKLKGIWYDFSQVEWRIRLGSILWADTASKFEEEEAETLQSDQVWTERNILLLQISLSCELLLRLDAVSGMDEDEVRGNVKLTADELKNFLDMKTRKTDWDLVLARAFLENVQVVASDTLDLPPTPKPRGIFSILSRQEDPRPQKPAVVFLPRHQSRQLSGLLQFAESLRWPNIDLVVADLVQKLHIPSDKPSAAEPATPYGQFLTPDAPISPSIYGTPLATPRSATSLKSYFGSAPNRPTVSRNNTSRSLQIQLSANLLPDAVEKAANPMEVGGWLSRSYLTGLILCGEAISHFLMSTLLENDKQAIAALGDSANLYGGFLYGERSFWSKSCIVGRVLACVAGSKETMGWISIDSIPYGFANEWVAVDSEQLPFENPPRIFGDVLAQQSAIIPEPEKESTSSDDLTLPLDPTTPPMPSVGFTEWTLTSNNHNHPSPPSPGSASAVSTFSIDANTYTATLTFSSLSTLITHTLTLTYDVHFITSFPCTPPSTATAKSTNPLNLLKRSDSTRSMTKLSRWSSRRNSHGYEPLMSHPPDSGKQSPVPAPPDEEERPQTEPMPAHPMLKSYRYRMFPVTEILNPAFVAHLSQIVSNTTDRGDHDDTTKEDKQTETKNEEQQEVLVLDARGERDLELLARAWCSARGFHAIISRVGRTCLACSVREARGLGVSVVVRV